MQQCSRMMERAPDVFSTFHRCALVTGHPGHELRVFGWAVENRPRLYVLTDGSGSGRSSRISTTRKLALDVGAREGEIFGSTRDHEFYRAIITGRTSFFVELLDVLAASFIEHDIDCVLGDAAEGFNPTHDICRYLVDSTVELVSRESGRTIANYQYRLTERELGQVEQHDNHCIHVTLSDAAFAAKLAAARTYVALDGEVTTALAHYGEDHFRTECMKPAEKPSLETRGAKPYYEVFGEERVRTGVFDTVLRYENHVQPIRQALTDRVLSVVRKGAIEVPNEAAPESFLGTRTPEATQSAR